MLKTETVSFAVVLSCCVCVALGKVDISSVRSVSCQQCDDKNPCPKDYDCNDASGRCQLSECSRAKDCGVGKECLSIPCCEVENQPMDAMTKICREKDVPLCDVMCLVPDPVCGSDGVTYDCGATDAHCHATCVKHEGDCGAAPSEVDIATVQSISCQRCDDLNPCPEPYSCNRAGLCQVSECRRNRDCAQGQKCLAIPCCEVETKPRNLMSKICRAKGMPLCEIQCLVPEPVCGRNGVTYNCGETDAQCHATCVKYEGECRVDDHFNNIVCKKCKRDLGFARGNNYVCEELNGRRKVWTHRECEKDADCDGDDVCKKKGCCEGPMAGLWGARDPNSICVPKEQGFGGCIEIYQPVCSYAGHQFDNYCFAEVAGECVEYEGFCEDD